MTLFETKVILDQNKSMIKCFTLEVNHDLMITCDDYRIEHFLTRNRTVQVAKNTMVNYDKRKSFFLNAFML